MKAKQNNKTKACFHRWLAAIGFRHSWPTLAWVWYGCPTTPWQLGNSSREDVTYQMPDRADWTSKGCSGPTMPYTLPSPILPSPLLPPTLPTTTPNSPCACRTCPAQGRITCHFPQLPWANTDHLLLSIGWPLSIYLWRGHVLWKLAFCVTRPIAPAMSVQNGFLSLNEWVNQKLQKIALVSTLSRRLLGFCFIFLVPRTFSRRTTQRNLEVNQRERETAAHQEMSQCIKKNKVKTPA